MAEKTLGDCALEYAELGFEVFPIVPQGKNPATEHGLKDATRDPEQIRKWWQANPYYNIAIRCGGPSHLTVIDEDLDEEKGKFGTENMRQYEREHGAFPETITVLTPRGGRHRYYLADTEYRNGQSSNGVEFVDVRGEGGYVLAPPSVGPNGREYVWEDDPRDGEVSIARVIPGSSLEEFLGATKARKKQDGQQSAEIGKIPDGQRTSSLMRLVGTLVDKGLSPDAIKAAVREENFRRCEPPLSDDELEMQVFPALDRGWLPTKPYTEGRVVPGLPVPVELSEMLADLPPLDPVLVDGVLRKGHKMLISGPSKAGKSFALMELAIAIAEGTEWLGAQCTKGRVMYINMEISDASCYNRFAKIYEAKGLDPSGNISVWGLRGYSMPISKLAPQIIGRCKDYTAIIIDPLYKVMEGADENSNSDVARMVGYFDQIARDTGASVIYAHHFAKGNAGDRNTIDRGAGAGTFSRDPDAILTLTQIDYEDEEDPQCTAWRVEFVLREFQNRDPYDVYWEYPLHTHDEDGLLASLPLQTSLSQADHRKESMTELKKNMRIAQITAAAKEACTFNHDSTFKLNQFEEAYKKYESGLDKKTLRARLKEAGYKVVRQDEGMPAVWGLGT